MVVKEFSRGNISGLRTRSPRNLLILAITGVLLVQAATLLHFAPEILSGKPDFARLYSATRILLSHFPTSAAIGGSPDTLHTPFEKLLLAPLALLPYPAAFFAWDACNFVFFSATLALLWKRVPRLQGHFAWVVIAAGTFYPVLVTMVQGQDSILLLLLLTLFVVSIEDGHEFRAGALLAVAMFKFVLVLPLLAAMVLARRSRCLAGFLATSAAVAAVTIGVVRWRGVSDYLNVLFHFGRMAPSASGDAPHWMPNFRGLLYLLFPETLSPFATTFIALLFCVMTLAVVYRRWAAIARKNITGLQLSMLLVAATLVAYHYYVHDATLLVLPCVIAANHFAGMQPGTFNRRLFSVAVITLYAAPILLPTRIGMPAMFMSTALLALSLYREVSRQLSAPVLISPIPTAAASSK